MNNYIEKKKKKSTNTILRDEFVARATATVCSSNNSGSCLINNENVRLSHIEGPSSLTVDYITSQVASYHQELYVTSTKNNEVNNIRNVFSIHKYKDLRNV